MIEKDFYINHMHTTCRCFSSITEFMDFIKNHKVGNCFANRDRLSTREDERAMNFTGTKTYQEAEDLLVNGWSECAEELNKKLKAYNVTKTKQKQVYGMQGYQACVPRYLQGIPDSMISSKKVTEKKKVVKIYKRISYNYKVSLDTIIEESMKVLRAVQDLEAAGTRVELHIICSVKSAGAISTVTVCIKKSSQRLNINQIAFPLVHPSMLRRIWAAYAERCPECNYKRFVNSYGCPEDSKEVVERFLKDGYVIPAIVNEEEITDLEKYRI